MTQPTRPLPPPPESFFDELERAEARVLMLDYDGTLAPFRVEPSAARPYRGVRQLVGEIMFSGHTRLAIITGRPVKGFLDLLAVDPPPEVWGSFGWEHLNAGGSYQMSTLSEIAKDGLAESVMRANDAGFGSRIEAKPSSVSLHWRGLSAAASRKCREWGQASWGPMAESHGLDLHKFDGGLELRVPGRDKGTAVGAILAGSPRNAVVAFLGDDLSDEDAFRALPAGGLSVLVRREFRPTAAESWIRPPEELLSFLRRWNSAGTRGQT